MVVRTKHKRTRMARSRPSWKHRLNLSYTLSFHIARSSFIVFGLFSIDWLGGEGSVVATGNVATSLTDLETDHDVQNWRSGVGRVVRAGVNARAALLRAHPPAPPVCARE